MVRARSLSALSVKYIVLFCSVLLTECHAQQCNIKLTEVRKKAKQICTDKILTWSFMLGGLRTRDVTNKMMRVETSDKWRRTAHSNANSFVLSRQELDSAHWARSHTDHDQTNGVVCSVCNLYARESLSVHFVSDVLLEPMSTYDTPWWLGDNYIAALVSSVSSWARIVQHKSFRG